MGGGVFLLPCFTFVHLTERAIAAAVREEAAGVSSCTCVMDPFLNKMSSKSSLFYCAQS